MLPFHTPTVVKVLRIVVLYLYFTLVPTTNAKSLTPLHLGVTATFGRDRDVCSAR